MNKCTNCGSNINFPKKLDKNGFEYVLPHSLPCCNNKDCEKYLKLQVHESLRTNFEEKPRSLSNHGVPNC